MDKFRRAAIRLIALEKYRAEQRRGDLEEITAQREVHCARAGLLAEAMVQNRVEEAEEIINLANQVTGLRQLNRAVRELVDVEALRNRGGL